MPELEAGLRFYGEVFGFVETARPFPTMAILDANNVTVCMHEKQAGSKSSSAGSERRRYERHWTPVHLDLHVGDFDGVLNKVRAQGGVDRERVPNARPHAGRVLQRPVRQWVLRDRRGECLRGPTIRVPQLVP